jgi:hypothetical protein
MSRKTGSGGALLPAVEALNRAADSLSVSAARMKCILPRSREEHRVQLKGAISSGTQPSPVAPTAEEQPKAGTAGHDKEFIEVLEQNGQIADVNGMTDLSKLSPSITHIRFPDGHIERLQFNSGPYVSQ